MERLSFHLGKTLPKGTSGPLILTIGREIVAKGGKAALAEVAKLTCQRQDHKHNSTRRDMLNVGAGIGAIIVRVREIPTQHLGSSLKFRYGK